MAVSITVPIAADVPLDRPYMGEELTIADFTPEAKIVLNRVYAGLLVAGPEATPATLANGAAVNSTARVVQWLVEAVAAAE